MFTRKTSDIAPFFYFILRKYGVLDPEISWEINLTLGYSFESYLVNGKNSIELLNSIEPDFNGKSDYSLFAGEFLMTHQDEDDFCLNCLIEKISQTKICEPSLFCYENKKYLVKEARISNLVPIGRQDRISVYKGKYKIRISEIINQ